MEAVGGGRGLMPWLPIHAGIFLGKWKDPGNPCRYKYILGGIKLGDLQVRFEQGPGHPVQIRPPSESPRGRSRRMGS